MASVIQKGNRWYVVVPIKGEDNRWRNKWLSPSYATQKEAKAARRDIEQQANYTPPGKITVAAYLKQWLDSYVKKKLSPSVYRGYEQICRTALIPALGSIPLSKLTNRDIQKFYDSEDGKLSGQTIRHHQECLHCALQMAIKPFGYIQHNPADSDGLILPSVNPPEMTVMDEGQVSRFLEAAQKTPFYELFYLVLYTGLRRGEALALRWRDVDLLLCKIYVNRNVLYIGRKLIYKEPKTKKSKQPVDLTPSTALMLKSLFDKQMKISGETGLVVGDDTLVFTYEDGEPILPPSATQAWRRIAGKIEIDISLHGARHTHASLLLKQGAPAKVIQERLRHADIGTTLNLYSHLLPGMAEDAARKFDEDMNNR